MLYNKSNVSQWEEAKATGGNEIVYESEQELWEREYI